ncbi:hypothetical protein [Nostoc sp. ChiSLP03a]|uniref:hypothetical protein n=1 Tax=Nostoc sp. ChiSLP03a TaxID=3075380 RepID=UPI002AD4C13C|nr:hypothetical protein [Nostoc sp. ChiSLP03a]
MVTAGTSIIAEAGFSRRESFADLEDFFESLEALKVAFLRLMDGLFVIPPLEHH